MKYLALFCLLVGSCLADSIALPQGGTVWVGDQIEAYSQLGFTLGFSTRPYYSIQFGGPLNQFYDKIGTEVYTGTFQNLSFTGGALSSDFTGLETFFSSTGTLLSETIISGTFNQTFNITQNCSGYCGTMGVGQFNTSTVPELGTWMLTLTGLISVRLLRPDIGSVSRVMG